jgi:F420-dependent oxidoreductase-like protein
MRIGIHAEHRGTEVSSLRDVLDLARDAEDRGVDLWMPQTFGLDAITALSVVGPQTTRLQVGTFVVPTYTRHPFTMAMQALTAQSATNGRFTLGIGLSHRPVIEQVYGLSFETPVRHLREYLSILVPVLHGENVAFKGEEFSTGGRFPIVVPGAEPPPVLVAALGAQLLRIAGRLADGTALWMVGPKTIADHITPIITASAEAAGRPRPEIVAGLPVTVTSDVDDARRRAEDIWAPYGTMPSYRAMLDREGVSGPADIVVMGDEESVAAQLQHILDVGATRLALTPVGSPEERRRTFDLLGELAAPDPRGSP